MSSVPNWMNDSSKVNDICTTVSNLIISVDEIVAHTSSSTIQWYWPKERIKTHAKEIILKPVREKTQN
jgi:hypothetical protein